MTAANRHLAICLWAHQSIDCLGKYHPHSKSEGYTYYQQFGEIDPIRLKSESSIPDRAELVKKPDFLHPEKCASVYMCIVLLANAIFEVTPAQK